MYPVNFGDNEIDLEITLREGNNAPVVYPVTLAGTQWDPNNNYIYTLSAGRNKLTVMDVSVEPWADNEQDEIPLLSYKNKAHETIHIYTFDSRFLPAG